MAESVAMAQHGNWHVDSAKKLGRRIGSARGSLSQRQLASKVGISAAYISRIEHGERIPSLQLLERIAATLEVELTWLRGMSATDGKRRQPISAAELELELDAIEAAIKRIRTQIRDPRISKDV